jgi:lysyl endopeptidase
MPTNLSVRTIRLCSAVVLAALAGYAAAQAARVESREAPAETALPRVKAFLRDAASKLPISAQISADAQSLDSLKERTPSAAIGVGREPATAVSAVSTGAALRLTVQSEGAAAIRSAIRLASSERGLIRITTFSPDGVDEPVAFLLDENDYGGETVWTAVTPGASQEIVIDAVAGSPTLEVSVVRISHFTRDPGASRAPSRKAFGDSQYCQVDLACVYNVATPVMQPSVLLASRAVAKMIYSDATGNSYDCTGTLLNSGSYPAPLFYTAYHCLHDATTAATLTTYWFFSRDYCQAGLPSAATVQLPGGATGIFVSQALDVALVRLKQMPPPQASYSGWDASYLAPGTLIMAIHHPSGDVKKASFGDVLGTNTLPVPFDIGTFSAGTFYVINWEIGVVEPGSSGSGLFSYNDARNYFYLRGTLTGGNATCSSIASRTYYSRLDNVYPFISTTLTQPPPTPAGTKVAAVEYYHAGFDHYFITANLDEVAKLDGGIFAGWARTGQSFSVYSDAPAGSSGVCRFFSTAFAPKSSHFYTPDANECATVKRNPSWQFEAVVFNASTPDAVGNCAGGASPVYRMYNNGQGAAPNHRYTTSLTTRSQMLARGWVSEGYGSVGVIMCSPQ